MTRHISNRQQHLWQRFLLVRGQFAQLSPEEGIVGVRETAGYDATIVATESQAVPLVIGEDPFDSGKSNLSSIRG